MQKRIVQLPIKSGEDIKLVNILISKKSMRNIRLKMDANQNFSLSIPYSVSYSYAYNFLLSKSDWILKQIDRKDQINSLSPRYINGGKIWFLGNKTPLLVNLSNKNEINFCNDTLSINAKNTNESYVKALYIKWCKHYLFFLAYDMIEVYMREIFNKLKVPKQELVIKTMKTMWGNCKYQKNVITLNTYLINTPKQCIEYVVLHELVHTIYHNHGKEFKDFLTKYMPDWKKRKKLLNTFPLNF